MCRIGSCDIIVPGALRSLINSMLFVCFCLCVGLFVIGDAGSRRFCDIFHDMATGVKLASKWKMSWESLGQQARVAGSA